MLILYHEKSNVEKMMCSVKAIDIANQRNVTSLPLINSMFDVVVGFRCKVKSMFLNTLEFISHPLSAVKTLIKTHETIPLADIQTYCAMLHR